MEFLTMLDWSVIAQIILIDILLGGDNAVVIALACRNLHPNQRRKGILWGTAGAIILRIILVAFAVTLLRCPARRSRARAHVPAGSKPRMSRVRVTSPPSSSA